MLNPDRGNEPAMWPGAVDALDAVNEKNTRHQVIFREVNEHIAELTAGWAQTGVSLFICECSDHECSEALEITPAEYERVRGDGARFFVRAGHQLPELERVAERNGRFLVVEKVGHAGTLARSSDPRQFAGLGHPSGGRRGREFARTGH